MLSITYRASRLGSLDLIASFSLGSVKLISCAY